MPVVIATVGAPNANSYVTVAEATAYYDELLGKTAWASASVPNREAAVITASRSLDQYMKWIGYPTTETQSMGFPRVGAFDRDNVAIDDDVIPVILKQATFELAYYALTKSGLSFVNQTLDRVKVAVIDVKFTERSVDTGIPAFIEQMIEHLGSPLVPNKGDIRSVRLTRV